MKYIKMLNCSAKVGGRTDMDYHNVIFNTWKTNIQTDKNGQYA